MLRNSVIFAPGHRRYMDVNDPETDVKLLLDLARNSSPQHAYNELLPSAIRQIRGCRKGAVSTFRTIDPR